MRKDTCVSRVVLACLVGGWVCLACAGVAWLSFYSTRTGVAASLAEWPADSSLARSPKSTLILFLHPECPCSRATVAELERLLPHTQGRIDPQVVFTSSGSSTWAETFLSERVRALPNVAVRVDPGAIEAARFGARTSGQAMLFDASGQVVFIGGITAARGHEGDSVGRQAILDYAAGRLPSVKHSRVFGCALHSVSRLPAGAL